MKHTLTCLLLLLPFSLLAQLHVIAEGPSFEEPENGFGKILALKDGSTAYLHIEPKDDIEIRIYDPAHKEIVSKKIDPGYGKLKQAKVEGIYEIGNNITIFMGEADDHTPLLYRILIDKKTGDLREFKILATLKKATMGDGYAVAFGSVPLPDFIVRKDLYSDSYGVICYNTLESDRNKRVTLIQYNGNGTETARSFLSSPESKYKYTQILDFVVVGEIAYALLYSYNTEKSGGAANELLLAKAIGSDVSYENIGKSVKNRINDGLLRYNPITHHLILLTTEFIASHSNGFFSNSYNNTYDVNAFIIDPDQPELKQPVSLSNSKILSKYRRVFSNKDDKFGPMPQNVYINDNGSFTILLEDVTQIMRQTNYSRQPAGVIFGTAALITYDEHGNEESSVLIPLSQTTLPSMFSQVYRETEGYYIAKRENTAVALNGGNQYKSLVYINGKKNDYVMLNDIEENTEKIKKGKITNIRGVSDCDAWVYDLSDTVSPIPSRTLLFNKERRKDSNLAIFTISDYDREHDVYATLKLEKGKVKLAWLSSE